MSNRYPLSVAPMMGWTDRHARYFLRQISRHILLYTEMVTSHALLNGDADYLLAYHDCEHPLALQLGGSEPDALARCARMAQDSGYDEVNLNVGCPSDRVQSGRFGACLMLTPELVAQCVAAMVQAVSIPVSVKCRVGVDKQDDYASLAEFVRQVSAAGCRQFIVHARNAWLKGLSPKQNRDVPPLKYAYVYRLKEDFPDLFISLNGGVKTLQAAEAHLQYVDSVMIGREAYHNPYLLADVDRLFFADNQKVYSRDEIVAKMVVYAQQQIEQGQSLHSISRHMLGLFAGCPGAKKWRQMLSDSSPSGRTDARFLFTAAACVQPRPCGGIVDLKTE